MKVRSCQLLLRYQTNGELLARGTSRTRNPLVMGYSLQGIRTGERLRYTGHYRSHNFVARDSSATQRTMPFQIRLLTITSETLRPYNAHPRTPSSTRCGPLGNTAPEIKVHNYSCPKSLPLLYWRPHIRLTRTVKELSTGPQLGGLRVISV